jgi:hypothetical protein
MVTEPWGFRYPQDQITGLYPQTYADAGAVEGRRRTSASRGKLFYRLIQQAVAIPSQPYRVLCNPVAAAAPLHDGGA